MSDFQRKIHLEQGIDHFNTLDGSITFFTFVKAAMMKVDAKRVLDFGAGRGAALIEDRSVYRKNLRDLRTTGAHVSVCDLDEVVLTHPASDEQHQLKYNEPLPYDDESLDVIVSDMTFEHVANDEFTASELLRVLKPGGYICARTPNKLGYVQIITSLIPNSLHSKLLKSIQPNRKSEDVFPTVYKMNSPSQIKRLFPECEVMHLRDSADPAYYFGNKWIYRFFLLVHKFMPSLFATTILFFIRKPGGELQ